MEQPEQKGSGERVYKARDLQGVLQQYRQGIMEKKAQREALLLELEEVDKSIARTEGALLAISALLEQPGSSAADVASTPAADDQTPPDAPDPVPDPVPDPAPKNGRGK